MNLLQKLWGWLASPFAKTAVPAIEEQECCDDEDCELVPQPPSAGEILQEVLMSEGIGGNIIEKHNIVSLFEEWYQGECSPEAIRNSIPEFRKAARGAVNAKLSRIK